MSDVMSPVEPPVRVAFVPTVDDQVRASNAILYGSGWARFFRMAAPVLFAAWTVVTVWDAGWSALLGSAMIFPIMLAVTLLMPVITRRTITRHFKQNPHLLGGFTYTFTPEDVQIESPIGSSRMPWTSFVRARETPELILLYFARKAAYFVPRRAMRDEDERRLKQWLSARLGPRAEFKTDLDGR